MLLQLLSTIHEKALHQSSYDHLDSSLITIHNIQPILYNTLAIKS